jgi:hypothetical protein
MAELAWEVQYYAKISPQLGEPFATVVERALAIATEFPDMGSPYKHGTQRDGSWTKLDPVEDLEIPDDLGQALKESFLCCPSP